MAVVLHEAAEKAGDAVELVDIQPVPRNQRIVLQRGLLLLPEGIHRRVDFLELSAGGIGDDARPGFVGFTERNRIGVTWSAVAAQGFIGTLRPRPSPPSDR